MHQVTVEEAGARLPELMREAQDGEEVVITHNTAQVKLVPVKPRRKAGSAKGVILYMADDFDAPLEDFQDYM